jgi:hypothetical protein
VPISGNKRVIGDRFFMHYACRSRERGRGIQGCKRASSCVCKRTVAISNCNIDIENELINPEPLLASLSINQVKKCPSLKFLRQPSTAQ